MCTSTCEAGLNKHNVLMAMLGHVISLCTIYKHCTHCHSTAYHLSTKALSTKALIVCQTLLVCYNVTIFLLLIFLLLELAFPLHAYFFHCISTSSECVDVVGVGGVQALCKSLVFCVCYRYKSVMHLSPRLSQP